LETRAALTRVRQGDIGYVSLWVPDLPKAEDFYTAVLGWRLNRGSSDESRLVQGVHPSHGLMSLAGGNAYLRELGLRAVLDRPTLFLCFAVDDVEAAVERVRAAGGEAVAPKRQPHGYVADCVDDQGTAFAMYEPVSGYDERPPVNGLNQGDVSYVTMHAVDSGKARAFYGSVLGWRFEAGTISEGWQVPDIAPMAGMAGGATANVTMPMYRVDDVRSAVERVRAAGGTATDPVQHPYGWTSDCVDDQGAAFYLGQH